MLAPLFLEKIFIFEGLVRSSEEFAGQKLFKCLHEFGMLTSKKTDILIGVEI